MATTTDLINSLALQGAFPDSVSSLFSNANFLSILNLEMGKEVVPLLNRVNEEYFLQTKTIALVSGTNLYRMPTRAIGSALRDVQLLGNSGSVTGLNRLFEEDRTSLSSNAQGYFLKGNQVEVSPVPTSSTDSLRLLYFRRPSKLVLPIACGQILSINTVLNQVVVTSLPSTMTAGVLTDFVQANSPYDILDMDLAIASVSGTTVTFASLPADLAINDYICLAGESCVPGIPEELISILVQAALCTALSSKKDKSVELELQKLSVMKESAVNMLSPRVKSADKKIVNRNSFLF